MSRSTPVTLRIFDVGGRLVRELTNDRLLAGRHAVHWDGRNASGRTVAAGVYFYRLETRDFRAHRRLVRVE